MRSTSTPARRPVLAMAVAVVCVAAAGCSRDAPPKVELVDAPAVSDIAPLVKTELARASHDGKLLLVYVGASWCEPCRRFHEAAASGQLDATFGQLRLLVFDHDRDGDALGRAGYRSELIPLFVVPRADGTSSGNQIEGSIKGEGAVDEIAPRLRELLGSPP